MSDYKAPLRDLQFSLYEVNAYRDHLNSFAAGEAFSDDLYHAITAEAAKFAEKTLAPLNQSGDREGARLVSPGTVETPDGFKQAYTDFVNGGWPSMEFAEERGGQNLPASLATVVYEMFHGANSSWSLYPGLTEGATVTLLTHGSDAQRDLYLSKMVAGHWTGTMNLTEPHCGSDLGLLKTKATPQPDGSYRISGSKIFITSGEHDLSENIIHLVLARLPDAPAGVKGISLFIVPKFLVNDDGSLGDRNKLVCGSVEHKMGLKGSATCVMNYDDAQGFLIGKEHCGLACMFTMINKSRLGVSIQAVGIADGALQSSYNYSHERLQGRAPGGTANPDKIADPIIVHADIRHKLLTQKALLEGGRFLCHYSAMLVDHEFQGDSQQAKTASEKLAIMIPIVKACVTEWSVESVDLALQSLGGHGYIAEWDIEQRYRDVRPSRIYEGTTHIQALDLLGRKILGGKGQALEQWLQEMENYCESVDADASTEPLLYQFRALLADYRSLLSNIVERLASHPDYIPGVASDFLMISGYLALAFMWAKAAVVSQSKLQKPDDDADFYTDKLNTADFFYQKILPRVSFHTASINAGVESLPVPILAR
ncbi:acyl-CoA dehydrogenase C-terminal domain-containing protein [Oceanicoccus sp. KOV_DT_Chl]|uniref:acyl-CoA dehydrogenase C-terminal domain-containing protein n=1 Tax=Oceanicoccus sp. KOV_DT_Chl TaxID=1904639 RepID=UPI000C7D82AE|nr:acyl-CoA dehydrogenase C-terminal domain-containing protein [Oceanicoccus sp. KOV_DT_Chl]